MAGVGTPSWGDVRYVVVGVPGAKLGDAGLRNVPKAGGVQGKVVVAGRAPIGIGDGRSLGSAPDLSVGRGCEVVVRGRRGGINVYVRSNRDAVVELVATVKAKGRRHHHVGVGYGARVEGEDGAIQGPPLAGGVVALRPGKVVWIVDGRN